MYRAHLGRFGRYAATTLPAAANQKTLNPVNWREERLGPIDKIFWIRVGFAVLAGVLAGALGYVSLNPMAFRGIGIGFLIYFISYIAVRVAFTKQLPPSDYKKLITTGMLAYVFMFLFVWVLYNTFTYGQQTE